MTSGSTVTRATLEAGGGRAALELGDTAPAAGSAYWGAATTMARTVAMMANEETARHQPG